MKAPATRCLLTAYCLVAVACLPALGQLADTSPFLPPGSVDAGGVAADEGTLELRGIMSTSDGLRFCIYDSVKKSSAWVALNEEGHDFVVRGADPANDRVTLQDGGRTLTLELKASKTVALASSPSTLGGRGPYGPNPPPGITAADEAKRLEAISREVRRRRMLREQVDKAQDRAARQNGYMPPQ
jgi:hypothetical protein